MRRWDCVNVGDVAKRGRGRRRRRGRCAGAVVRGRAGGRGPHPSPRRSRRRRAARSPVRRGHARSPRHDGGELYVVEPRRTGPPIVFSHGVTLTSQRVGQAVRGASRPRASARRVRPPRPRRVGARRERPLDREPRPTTCGPCSRGSTCATRARRPLDGRHRGAGVRDPPPRRRWPSASRGIVLLSTSPHTARRATRAHPGRARACRRPVARLRRAACASANLGLLIARLGFGDDPHPSHVELTRQMLAECPRETSATRRRALLGLDLTDELPRSTCPTLVIGGTADVLTPPRDSRTSSPSSSPARELVEYAGRRAHAHARAHRGARRPDRRLRARASARATAPSIATPTGAPAAG